MFQMRNFQTPRIPASSIPSTISLDNSHQSDHILASAELETISSKPITQDEPFSCLSPLVSTDLKEQNLQPLRLDNLTLTGWH